MKVSNDVLLEKINSLEKKIDAYMTANTLAHKEMIGQFKELNGQVRKNTIGRERQELINATMSKVAKAVEENTTSRWKTFGVVSTLGALFGALSGWLIPKLFGG